MKKKNEWSSSWTVTETAIYTYIILYKCRYRCTYRRRVLRVDDDTRRTGKGRIIVWPSSLPSENDDEERERDEDLRGEEWGCRE